MLRNVDNIVMVQISEPIFQAGVELSDLDISFVDNTSLKFYKDGYPDMNSDGSANEYAYHIKLMTKIGETAPSSRKKFIDYQVSFHKDPKKWLHEIENLLNRNYYQFDEKPIFWDAYQNFMSIISEKIQEFDHSMDSSINSQQKISFKSYNEYLSHFDYNYLNHPSILFYFSSLHEALEIVKKEILNNLVNLNSEDKRAYFEKLKFEAKGLTNDHHDFSLDVISYQKKYKIKKFNILEALLGENELYKILSFPEEIKNVDKPSEAEDEILSIRFAFYNYYYYDFLAQFLDFIITQEDIYFPKQIEGNFASEIFWQKSDTDLLELITALIESGSINNQTKNITRKDTIRYFETFFNCQIKDAENKLSKATARKNDKTQFLTTLSKAFIEYCDKKDK